MTKYLVIALGGAIGSITRFLIGNLISSYIKSNYPWGTFVINISGSLIIGFFLVLITERIPTDQHWRLAIIVGFTGAYTTFSTFEYEILYLLEKGKIISAILYITTSIITGLLAVWAGALLARQISVK
ncbi:MAG: CrcB protein [bacterium]|nr:MAG: CrcB protein [bacterium]